MTTLRRRPYLVGAMLVVVMLGLHASSATLGAAAVEYGATEEALGDDTVAQPTNTYILAFLAGYIVADVVDDLFGKGFLPFPTDGVGEETFDF